MTESGSSPGSNPATGKSPQPEFSFRYGAEGIAILAMKGAWTKEHTLFPGLEKRGQSGKGTRRMHGERGKPCP